MTAKGYYGLMLAFGLMGAFLVLIAVLFTNPTSIGPFGVTVWFLLVLGVIASLLAAALFKVKVKSPRIENTEEKLLQNSWRQGWLLGGALVAILALSSLKQLAWRDAGLILAVTVLVEIFLRSRK